jgi:hypothetical protein
MIGTGMGPKMITPKYETHEYDCKEGLLCADRHKTMTKPTQDFRTVMKGCKAVT